MLGRLEVGKAAVRKRSLVIINISQRLPAYTIMVGRVGEPWGFSTESLMTAFELNQYVGAAASNNWKKQVQHHCNKLMFSFPVMLKPVLLAQVTETCLQKKLDKIIYYILKVHITLSWRIQILLCSFSVFSFVSYIHSLYVQNSWMLQSLQPFFGFSELCLICNKLQIVMEL